MTGRTLGGGSALSRRTGRWHRRSGRRRAVSDVVATILLLALTVVLFASIFAFVTRFPTPPPQNVDQFEASVTTNGTSSIHGLWILHGAGPIVPSGDKVYLESTASSADWQFHQSSGIPVAWGMGNSTAGWSAGQYWITWFVTPIPLPSNLTVYVVSPSSLLYTAYVPGVTPNNPPVVVSTGTVPSNPTVGSAFQIYALIYGNTGTLQVNITLSEIPGLPSTAQKMVNVSGRWVYNVSAHATTTNGSYVGFIQGKNTSGTTVAGQVAIAISGASTGGGGGGSGSFTVVAGVTQTPPLPVVTGPPNIYLTATVNYTGTTKVNAAVNFTVAQLEGGRDKTVYKNSTTLAGQTLKNLVGPTDVVLYSTSTFGTWLLNSSVTVTASVTLTGLGTVKAATTIYTQGLLAGDIYTTTSSSTGTTGTPWTSAETSFSHSCSTSTSCPYLDVSVWDNWTTSPLGGPASLTFNGSWWSNITSCTPSTGCTATSGTVASSTVGDASFYTVNLEGGTTRWKPGGSNLAANDKFTLWMLVTVTDGTQVVGYVWDSTLLTLS